MIRRSIFVILFISVFAEAAEGLIQVPVSFQEALAPSDTTSSSRFKDEYKSAIETGLNLIGAEVKKCGYEIQASTEFYAASDPLQAQERAAKAQSENTWLIVGPRRSNHFILTSHGATATPAVSLMANATDIFSLGDLYRTLGTSNAQLSKSLVKIAKEYSKKSKLSYVSIVNEDCVFCLDLAKQFDESAKGFSKLKEIRVIGDTPDIVKIKKELGNAKPNFVLLPNYSKPSAHVIAGLKSKLPAAFYLGGDGWGTNTFGFVQSGIDLDGVVGFTARGSIPSQDALKSFRTGRALLKNPSAAKRFPDSNTALSILKIMEGTADILCSKKPKSRNDFIDAFRGHAARYMKPSWGVGVWKLENENMNFYRAEK